MQPQTKHNQLWNNFIMAPKEHFTRTATTPQKHTQKSPNNEPIATYSHTNNTQSIFKTRR